MAGRVPELALFEAMTWCYAGLTASEIDELAQRAVAEGNLACRRHACIGPILEWARQAGLRAVVVSASPEPVVRTAALLWGFSPAEVTGARCLVLDGVAQPALAGPIPYGKQKVAAARSLIGSSRWLAAFGDSAFDLPMLLEAEVAVAVRPKPDLVAELGGQAGALSIG
jgi:phosphoserine phosphatase